MKVESAMHEGVEWVSAETPLKTVAMIMRDNDVGAIPVGENDRLIGMITDRDIAVRAVANGVDMSELTARDIMSSGIVYCRTGETIDDAIRLMEDRQIRRLPVLNDSKRMVGMLSLGDVSHKVNRELTGELARAISAHHH